MAADGLLHRLKVAEIEGDILKAKVAKNLANMEALHKNLANPLVLYQRNKGK